MSGEIEFDDDNPFEEDEPTLEPAYVKFMNEQLKIQAHCIAALQAYGINTLSGFISFVQLPMGQIFGLIDREVFAMHSNEFVRMFALAHALQDATSPLYEAKDTNILTAFDPHLFTIVYMTQRRDIRATIVREYDAATAAMYETIISNKQIARHLADLEQDAASEYEATKPRSTFETAHAALAPPSAERHFTNSVSSPSNPIPATIANPAHTLHNFVPVPPAVAFQTAEATQDATLDLMRIQHRLQNPTEYHSATAIPRILSRPSFPSRIRWNGKRETFADFQSAFEGQLHMALCGYATRPDFASAYLQQGPSCLQSFPDIIGISHDQLRADNNYIFGAIMVSCSSAIATHRMLDRHKAKSDGILAWADCVNAYVLEGTKKLQATTYEETIQTKFTPHYPNGLVGFVDDYRAAFSGLFGLQKIYTDIEMTNRLRNNVWTPDTSALLAGIDATADFITTCNHLQDHGVRVAAFELQAGIAQAHKISQDRGLQGHPVLSDPYPPLDPHPEPTLRMLLNTLVRRQRPPFPDGFTYHPSIWKNLSPETREELSRVRNEAMSQISDGTSTVPSTTSTPPPSNPPLATTAVSPHEPLSSSSPAATPRQYPARSAQLVAQDTDLDAASILEALTQAMQQEHDFFNDRFSYNTVTRDVSTHVDPRRCNLTHLDTNSYLSISDDGADTCVIGDGWNIESYTTRTANLIGFDATSSRKSGLPIVSAVTAVDSNGSTHLLRVHEAVYNQGSATTLLSEYQIREYGCIVDATSTRHRRTFAGDYGTQAFHPNPQVTIPFLINGGLMTFRHRQPTPLELSSLLPLDITSDTPWDPGAHHSDAFPVLPALHAEAPVHAFLTHTHVHPLTTIPPWFFDPSDTMHPSLGVPYPLRLDYHGQSVSSPPTSILPLPSYYSDTLNHYYPVHADDHRHLHLVTKRIPQDLLKLQPYLGFQSLEVIQHTLEKTTQLAKSFYRSPLRRHLKARFPQLNRPRLREKVATDTFFANCRGITGATCAQVFYGITTHVINIYGLPSESHAVGAYEDFLRSEGAPSTLRRDNSKVQTGLKFLELNRKYLVADEYTEPHHPQQNPAEMRAVKWIKEHTQILLDRQGAPPSLWLQAAQYLADLHNVSADETLRWETPTTMRHGDTPDISAFLHFRFYERILYLDPMETYPQTKEKAGYWVGIASNVGDSLTYKILTDDTVQIIHRSVVRPLDPLVPNHRITFASDLLPPTPDPPDVDLLFSSTRAKLEATLAPKRTPRPRCAANVPSGEGEMEPKETVVENSYKDENTSIPDNKTGEDMNTPRDKTGEERGTINEMKETTSSKTGEGMNTPRDKTGEVTGIVINRKNPVENSGQECDGKSDSSDTTVAKTPTADVEAIEFSDHPFCPINTKEVSEQNGPTRRSKRVPTRNRKYVLNTISSENSLGQLILIDNYDPRSSNNPAKQEGRTIEISDWMDIHGDIDQQKHQLREYCRLLDNMQDNEHDDFVWKALKVLDCRHSCEPNKPQHLELKVLWRDGKAAWIGLEAL